MGPRAFLILVFAMAMVFPAGISPGGDSALSAASRADRRKAARLVAESRKLDDVRAVRTLLKALLLDPDSSAAFYRLGYLHHKMNRRVAAKRYYNQAIKLSRCHAKALNNLAGIHLDKGKSAEAEKLYRRAIRCRSRLHAPYYNLALILQERGDAAGAARYYRRTLRIKPDHHRSHHNLGLLYAKQNRSRARGIRHLRRARDLNPRDPLNHFSLAKGLFDHGRYNLARKSFQAALSRAGRATSMRRDILRYLQKLDAK